MKNHSSRLARLEAKHAPGRPRFIILKDGIYTERGQAMTAEEYTALASDPAYDVTLCEVVYASNWKDTHE